MAIEMVARTRRASSASLRGFASKEVMNAKATAANDTKRIYSQLGGGVGGTNVKMTGSTITL